MSLVPSLLAHNLEQTEAFYAHFGFARSGCAPGWMELTRGATRLWFYDEPPNETAREPQLSGTLYVIVDDVEEIARTSRALVKPAWGPERMAYGYLELGIRDPNGYYLAFAEPLV